MIEKLTTRSDPEQQMRDLISRTLTLRADSIDESTRSIEAVMATENPVAVFDWERWEVIDEVLRMDGAGIPEQSPLLENHRRYSTDDVLGSVRNIRREGDQLIGRMYFDDEDPKAIRVWNKVKKRHIRDVSIGYRTTAFEDIPPNTRKSVGGRDYASGSRRLRITTGFEIRELSVTPIGADPKAKTRREVVPPPQLPADVGRSVFMNPQLRTFLESLGLRTDASETSAQEFLNRLTGDQRQRADAIAAGTLQLADAMRAEIAAARTTTPAPAPEPARATPAAPSAPAPIDPETVRAEGARAERQRIARVGELGETADAPAELRQRAIAEGWDEQRAAVEFLNHTRSSRTPAVGSDAPAGIVRNHERDCTQRSLGLALAMRSGVDVEKWAKRGKVQGWENLAQRADRYSDMSLIDICREALRMDNREIPVTRDETIRSAVSGGSLTKIFTDSVNAMLLQAYEEEPDTTVWVEEGEVADFKTNTDIRFAGNAALKKVGRGQTADHAASEDSAETYKAARYARQFVVDEQDIIDDSMNALSRMPQEMGQAARRLRPDLVYAMILANPTMADTGAVFNSTALTTAGGHANSFNDAATAVGGPLAAGTLQLLITKMRQQYRGSGRNKVPLNIVPQFLIVPPELEFTAKILVRSAERVVSSSDGTFNPLQGIVQPIVETRLGTIGVTDPDSGTAYTGLATNYWLAARKGLHAKVVYRRGTNRAPQVRSFTLQQGQWGIGWDINHDIGAKFIDFRGISYAKGAA